MFGRDLFRYIMSRYYRNAHNIKKLAGQFWTIFFYLIKSDFFRENTDFLNTGTRYRFESTKFGSAVKSYI